MTQNYDKAVMIHRLEVCLSDIRKIARWKGVELANMLGLSRQAISTLEKQKSRLTLAQYIAIRHLLDAWMEQHPENRALPRVVTLLLDEMRIFGKDYDDLRGIVSTIAATASGGASQEATDVLAKVFLDEWEAPARAYCYEQLGHRMVSEKLGVTAESEPVNWTTRIFEWRNSYAREE